MATSMGEASAAKDDPFIQLRRRLDSLNYHDEFTKESFPVVRNLLADVEQLMQERENWDRERAEWAKQKWKLENQADPLKRTIAYLTTENNQLHIDLIYAKDARDEDKVKTERIRHTYEEELTGMRFLNTQYMKRMEEKEREWDAERRKFAEIVKQAEGKTGKDVLYVNEIVPSKILLTYALEPLLDQHEIFPPPTPETYDTVQAMEAHFEEVQEAHQRLTDSNVELESQIDAMRGQIANREEEIARLDELLEAKRASLESSGNGAQNRIEQLEMQLEYMQDTVVELETKLTKSARESARAADMYNREREQLLKEIENSKDKNETLQRNLDKLEALVSELGEMQSRVWPESPRRGGQREHERPHIFHEQPTSEDLHNHVKSIQDILEDTNGQFRTEFENLRSENKRLRAALVDAKSEAEFLEEDLESAREQLGKLTEMQAELKGLEKERDNMRELYEQVNEEMQNLRGSAGSSASLNGPSTAFLAQKIRTLIAERDNAEAKYQDAAHDLKIARQRLNDIERKLTSKTGTDDEKESDTTATRPKNYDFGIRTDLQDENARLRLILDEHKEAVEEAQARLHEVEEERAILQGAADAKAREYEQKLKNVMDRDGFIKEVERVTSDLGKELDRTKADLVKSQNVIADYRVRLGRLEDEREQERKKVEDEVNKRVEEKEQRWQSRMQQFQAALDDCAKDIKKYKGDIQTYEKQCQNLTKTLSGVEAELKETLEERANLLREVKTTHDQTQNFNRSKDELQNQVRALSIENEKLQATMKELYRDKDDSRNDLRAERDRCERLEKALGELRTEKFQIAMAQQQLLSSKKDLEMQLHDLTRKTTESATTLTKDTQVLQEEIKSLKKDIERFQRETGLKETELITLQIEKRKVEEKLKKYEDYIKQRRRNNKTESKDRDHSPIDSEDGHLSAQSPLDKKLMSEIEKTRKQLQEYERQIVARANERRKHNHSDNEPSPKVADSPELIESLLSSWNGNRNSLK